MSRWLGPLHKSMSVHSSHSKWYQMLWLSLRRHLCPQGSAKIKKIRKYYGRFNINTRVTASKTTVVLWLENIYMCFCLSKNVRQVTLECLKMEEIIEEKPLTSSMATCTRSNRPYSLNRITICPNTYCLIKIRRRPKTRVSNPANVWTYHWNKQNSTKLRHQIHSFHISRALITSTSNLWHLKHDVI